MKRLLSSKIITILLFSTLLLLTPVMATWIYSYPEYPEDDSDQFGFVMNEFEYAPVVTLPGDPGTTPAPDPDPPTPPEESTPDESTPEESTPEETTPSTPPTPPELDGTNHYNLIALIVGSLQECLDLGIEEDAYEAANLNHVGSFLYNELIRDNQGVLHSAHTSTSGGNLPKALENANAHKLHFTVDMNDAEDEVVVYSYDAVGKADEGKTVVVYRTIGRKSPSRWYPDLTSVVVGTAKVIKQSGKQVIDISTFVETPQS